MGVTTFNKKENIKPMKKLLFLFIFLAYSITLCAQIKVGVARKAITPKTPVWLSGYASRNKPSTEILHDLWAKALVIEENPCSRIVIVTTDILGLTHEISEVVANSINKKYGIKRSQLLLNSSHTHSGPAIWPSLSVIFNLNTADQQAAGQYTRELSEDIVEVIEMAMNNRAPMRIFCGHSSADFAINRRQPTDKGVIIGVNPNGRVDHDVMVVKIASPEGDLKAVLFGYACHNTTSNTYLVNGDFAGFAQIEIEKANQGVVAMFLQGCCADQNPHPRGSIELAAQHGKSLADAVQKVLSGDLHPVRSPIRTDYMKVDLDFPPFNPEVYEKEITGSDQYRQRRAMLMLEAYNKGWKVDRLPYPVQAIRFNNDLTILALSGEVVVDYSLRSKKEYPKENLFVAGYCNEVQGYIPTKRVLEEGGYEPETSMIYYGLPGPFANNIEDKVFSAIHTVMKHVGARPSK
jgi:neutral ceramidase